MTTPASPRTRNTATAPATGWVESQLIIPCTGERKHANTAPFSQTLPLAMKTVVSYTAMLHYIPHPGKGKGAWGHTVGRHTYVRTSRCSLAPMSAETLSEQEDYSLNDAHVGLGSLRGHASDVRMTVGCAMLLTCCVEGRLELDGVLNVRNDRDCGDGDDRGTRGLIGRLAITGRRCLLGLRIVMR